MNVIELKEAALYPKETATYHYVANGLDVYTAYIVLSRFIVDGRGYVAVIEGTGPSEPAAITHLAQKVKLVRDWIDLEWHGAFWPVLEAESRDRANNLKRMLGMTPDDTAKNEGGMS